MVKVRAHMRQSKKGRPTAVRQYTRMDHFKKGNLPVGRYTDRWQMNKYDEAQKYPYLIDLKTGKKLKRIKHGESDYDTDTAYCGDCEVPKGSYHWFGCDQERSPIPEEPGLQLLQSERAGDYSR